MYFDMINTLKSYRDHNPKQAIKLTLERSTTKLVEFMVWDLAVACPSQIKTTYKKVVLLPINL